MASHIKDGLLTVSEFMDSQVSGIQTRQVYIHIYVHSIYIDNFSQCCVRLIGRARHSIVEEVVGVGVRVGVGVGDETAGTRASSSERAHLIHSSRKKCSSVPVPLLLFLTAETHTNDRAI